MLSEETILSKIGDYIISREKTMSPQQMQKRASFWCRTFQFIDEDIVEQAFDQIICKPDQKMEMGQLWSNVRLLTKEEEEVIKREVTRNFAPIGHVKKVIKLWDAMFSEKLTRRQYMEGMVRLGMEEPTKNYLAWLEKLGLDLDEKPKCFLAKVKTTR